MGGGFGCHPFSLMGMARWSSVMGVLTVVGFPKRESWLASHIGRSSLGSKYTEF